MKKVTVQLELGEMVVKSKYASKDNPDVEPVILVRNCVAEAMSHAGFSMEEIQSILKYNQDEEIGQ